MNTAVLTRETAAEKQSSCESSNRLSARELAVLLMDFSTREAARVVMDVEPDTGFRMQLVRLIPDHDFRYEVANTVFGPKIAGDVGARSTQGHPTTDYGEPSGGGGMDFDAL